MSGGHCFFSIRTQFDNLGDALINRELLRLCAGAAQVELDLSRCPPAFRRQLLPDDIALKEHAGTARLLLALLRTRLRGARAQWFLSPGGYLGEIGWPELLRRVPNLLLLALFRLIGVRICLVGVSYERLGPRHLWLLRLRGRLLHAHHTRDRRSLEYARAQGLRPQGILPDLAMNLFDRERPAGPADHVALSFRTDQQPGQEEAVAGLLRRLNLPEGTAFLLVAQVARDVPGLRRLEQRLRAEGRQAELVVCDDLRQCEDAYDRCGMVIGNRLHALLVGGSRGCRMLACVQGDLNEKLRGLFVELGLEAQVLDMDAPDTTARALAQARQAPPFDGRPFRRRLQAGLRTMLEE